MFLVSKAFNFEEELPEYDMDSEDEEWLKAFNKKKVRFIHQFICWSVYQLTTHFYTFLWVKWCDKPTS